MCWWLKIQWDLYIYMPIDVYKLLYTWSSRLCRITAKHTGTLNISIWTNPVAKLRFWFVISLSFIVFTAQPCIKTDLTHYSHPFKADCSKVMLLGCIPLHPSGTAPHTKGFVQIIISQVNQYGTKYWHVFLNHIFVKLPKSSPGVWHYWNQNKIIIKMF